VLGVEVLVAGPWQEQRTAFVRSQTSRYLAEGCDGFELLVLRDDANFAGHRERGARGTQREDGRSEPKRRLFVMKLRILALFPTAPALLIACASTPGAQPKDMSVAGHEQAAASQDTLAGQHAAQYDPNAQTKEQQCGARSGCWTSISNPTKQHLADAEMHRKMAADHRAASQSLRDAEARACVGLSDGDRDMSPFDHREDIRDVQPAYLHNVSGKGGPADQLTGAVVTFRAVPGMTPEWLERVVECHIARNNALGNNLPEMPNCPLVPKGVSATVRSAGDGFAVRIEAQDATTASEVLRRAQALRNPG
jgi:hypothetical protein